MPNTPQEEKKLKVVSLEPKVVFVEKSFQKVESDDSEEETIIVAPFFIDEGKIIEDLSELIDKVYDEFSKACEKRNLCWEAELELGMEFGVKFNAKLKIAPKSGDQSKNQP